MEAKSAYKEPTKSSIAVKIDVVDIDEEPQCCCFMSHFGLRLYAVIVIVLNIVSLAFKRDLTFSIMSEVLAALAYVYMFFAITAKSPTHLRAAGIVLVLLVTSSILLMLIGVSMTDIDSQAQAANQARPAGSAPVSVDELRLIQWITVSVIVALQAGLAIIMSGFNQRYRAWLVRQRESRINSNKVPI